VAALPAWIAKRLDLAFARQITINVKTEIFQTVIPAKAGIHFALKREAKMYSRLRANDAKEETSNTARWLAQKGRKKAQ
jgi:hypothetical protein